MTPYVSTAKDKTRHKLGAAVVSLRSKTLHQTLINGTFTDVFIRSVFVIDGGMPSTVRCAPIIERSVSRRSLLLVAVS